MLCIFLAPGAVVVGYFKVVLDLSFDHKMGRISWATKHFIQELKVLHNIVLDNFEVLHIFNFDLSNLSVLVIPYVVLYLFILEHRSIIQQQLLVVSRVEMGEAKGSDLDFELRGTGIAVIMEDGLGSRSDGLRIDLIKKVKPFKLGDSIVDTLVWVVDLHLVSFAGAVID